MTRRVVVTGLGMVTPLGTGVEKNWEAACSGTSGIGPITKFDTTGFASQIAGEVVEFNPNDFLSKKDQRRTDLYCHYAMAATKMALADAGLEPTKEDSDRVGVVWAPALADCNPCRFSTGF